MTFSSYKWGLSRGSGKIKERGNSSFHATEGKIQTSYVYSRAFNYFLFYTQQLQQFHFEGT